MMSFIFFKFKIYWKNFEPEKFFSFFSFSLFEREKWVGISWFTTAEKNGKSYAHTLINLIFFLYTTV
jgi:hypothetical protein